MTNERAILIDQLFVVAALLDAHMGLPFTTERGEEIQRAVRLMRQAREVLSESSEPSERPIEVWHGDRKVTIYADTVIRVWGADIENEMSDEPRTHESVGKALDWLYERRS